jgi:hypothetical protein
MEINLAVFSFRKYMDEVSDKLIYLYSISETEFKKVYVQLPINLKLFVFELYENRTKTEDDIAEKWLEIFNYYYGYTRKLKKVEFTLRSSDHLKRFEIFLDKCILLMDNFPDEFIELFPLCPDVYWDKIDDLRETSFKQYRDSAEFTRCLTKCKKLSFGYENLCGVEASDDFGEKEDNNINEEKDLIEDEEF